MEQIRIAEIIQEVDVPGTIVQLRHLDFHDTPGCLISFAVLENQLSARMMLAALKRIEHPEHGSWNYTPIPGFAQFSNLNIPSYIVCVGWRV
jgi:hypothetical protein